MAKDIIIQDEYYRANHMSGVTRLRTELEEGGVCYWVPEDETLSLTEKTITENGTYTAMNEDVNGYSSVTVDVRPTLKSKLIRENGEYSARSEDADGYSEVVVNIANIFTAADEGKVVSNSQLISQTSRTIEANGTYDTTTNNETVVNVPNTYNQADEGKVVSNSQLISQTSRTIEANGTYDTTTNNSVTISISNTFTEKDNGKVVSNSRLVSQTIRTIGVNGNYDTTSNYRTIVNVPNSYIESDEGKVVANSQLVEQTSRIINSNGTYDTTTNNSVTVQNASNLSTKTITINGAYYASDDNLDGYSDITVSVPNTYTQFDEGKVVSNSQLVSQSTKYINSNDTYDTTKYNSVVVDVQPRVTYKTITRNGEYMAFDDGYDGFSGVRVNVRTYLSALYASENKWYYGEFDSVEVNVQPSLSVKTITSNGTYDASSDNLDGYSVVTVNVSGGDSSSSDISSYLDRTISTIVDNVTSSLGNYAFAGCSNLVTATFTACQNIGNSVFVDCYNLQSIYMLTEGVPYVNSYPFYDIGYPVDVYVLESMVGLFLASDRWTGYGEYEDKIHPYIE